MGRPEEVRKLTQTGGNTYYLTLPQWMIRKLNWRKGEKKVIRLEGGKIVIGDWKPTRG